MNGQDSFGLDDLLKEAANEEPPDFQHAFILDIDANSNHNASLLVLDDTSDPPQQGQNIQQPAQHEVIQSNHTSGGLQVSNDLPEEFGLMNADGSIRDLRNIETMFQAQQPQENVHPHVDDPHESQNPENMQLVDDGQDHAAHTSGEREKTLDNSEGKANDPTSQVNPMRETQLPAPTGPSETPHVHANTPPNQQHAQESHAQQVQGQLHLNEGKTASELIAPASALGRLPVGLQNLLLARARRQAYIEAEVRALQMAQNAASRVHAMVQNGEIVLNSTDDEAAHPYASLQRSPATDNQQFAQTAVLQEPPLKVRRIRSRTSNKTQHIRNIPPIQTPPAATPSPPAQMMSVNQEAPPSGRENLASAAPNSTAFSQAAHMLPQDISRVSSAQNLPNKLAVLKHSLAPRPTPHSEAPQLPCVQQQDCGCSNHAINAQPMSLNRPELQAGPLKHTKQSKTIMDSEKPVSARKRAREVHPTTHHIQPVLKNQTVNSSDEAISRPMVEQIMQMNGLRVQNHANNSHMPVTPNGHNVVVNKYGVKLRFSKNGQASKYCHICGRSALTASVSECANLLIGLCQKVICEKCSLIYDPQYGRQGELGCKRSLCIHCRAICPEDKARCFQYSRNNEKRRTRNLERKRQKKERQQQEKQREEESKRSRRNDDCNLQSTISPVGVADPNVF